MAREFVYQYNGKANLRDEPELVGDEVPIPAPDTIVRRRGTNYRVIAVSAMNARRMFPRYVIDLRPLDEFPSD